MQNKNVVVSLSGGMDSSTLLLKALNEYQNVIALSFDYGQKHRVELERAQSLVDYLTSKGKKVTYQVIKLGGLSSLLNSSLVEGGEDVPEGHYQEENMKETVVPNRNKIFSSITQAVALSAFKSTGLQTDIALGIHAGDSAVYPDCRVEFRDADHYAFLVGNWDAENVGFYAPYLEVMKGEILVDGEKLCRELDVDFDEVYKRTNTSYKPIYIPFPPATSRVEETLRETHGKWYSDYKSASSVERVEAFLKLGRPDPAEYADETGPVTWEHVVKEVSKVLNK